MRPDGRYRENRPAVAGAGNGEGPFPRNGRMPDPVKEYRRMVISFALILGIIVHVACQLFKVVFYSIKEKRLSLHYLLSAGGMPSTHSAFTATVTLYLGLTEGFASGYFTLGFAFTAIVVYDSLRLRGAVQTHSDILRKLAGSLSEEDQKRIPRLVGHTLAEIVVGLAIALVFSLAGYFLRGPLGL
jgi:acid phosphatase family membrane protein YuiD